MDKFVFEVNDLFANFHSKNNKFEEVRTRICDQSLLLSTLVSEGEIFEKYAVRNTNVICFSYQIWLKKVKSVITEIYKLADLATGLYIQYLSSVNAYIFSGREQLQYLRALVAKFEASISLDFLESVLTSMAIYQNSLIQISQLLKSASRSIEGIAVIVVAASTINDAIKTK